MTTEIDTEIAAGLDFIASHTPDALPPDWGQIVRDATNARYATGVALHRRRRLLSYSLAATIAIAGLGVLPALAGQGYFWFLSSPAAPTPVSPVVQVADGTSLSGTPWTLTAYRSDSQGLCFQLSTSSTTGGAECGAEQPIGWMTSNPTPSSPTFLLGPVTAQATTVRVVTPHATLEARVAAAPDALGEDVNFYITELPAADAHASLRIEALDSKGAVIANYNVPARTLPRTVHP